MAQTVCAFPYHGRATTHYALALAARQANETAQALAEIETALKLAPHDIQFAWVKAQLLDSTHPETATLWLKTLLEKDKKNFPVVLSAVRLLAREGRIRNPQTV